MNIDFNNWTMSGHLNVDRGLEPNFISVPHLQIRWRRGPSKENENIVQRSGKKMRIEYPGCRLMRVS